MSIFVDMKIGKRLGLGWGISLALMLLTVVISILYFNDFLRKLDHIININYAKVEHSVAIRSSFVDIMNNAGIVAVSNDRSSKEAAMKRIADARTRYGKALAGLEKLELNAEGKTLIARIKEEVPKRKEVTNRVIELGMSGNTGQAVKELSPMLTGILNLISISDELIKYNQGLSELRSKEINETARFAIYLLLFIGGINLIFGIFMAQKITKSITLPIMRSSQHIDLMAKGDFSIPVSEHGKKRGDEMGTFARSMDVMNVNLRSILQQVHSSSTKLSAASAKFTDSAVHLSHGAGNQVQRSNQVAAATTEMNQAAEDIARNASNMTASSHEAVNTGRQGQEVVEKTINEVKIIAETVETASEFVKQLGAQSEKIGDIITVIDEIADQTNLLALNAAIEAARAGEYGRGFAVVADEVRKLAERTSASTTEIGNMINSITEGVRSTVASMNTAQEKVTTGVEYSYQAQTALQSILASIDGLSGGINQVATAIEEMSATTDEISRDIDQISSVTKETSAASSQIVDASSELSSIAQELQTAVSKFKI